MIENVSGKVWIVVVTVFLNSFAMPALADGKALYDSLCQSCHGATGMGDGPGLAPDVIRPRPFKANVFKFDADMD